MKISSRRMVIRYLLVTGIVSLLLFALAAWVTAANAPQYMQTIAQIFSSWAPTLSVLILFRQLYPNRKLGVFLKSTLSARVNPLVFVLLLVLQAGIFGLALIGRVYISGKGVDSLEFVSLPAALLALVTQMTSGAMGEELGWRGYLLRELRQRHSLFVSALFVGIVWGFWHTPIWFTRGYAGMDLIRYIIFFLVEILSLSIIMSVFYDRYENLVIPMWIHFLVNFPVGLVRIDVNQYLGWMSLGCALFAIVLTFIERERLFLRRSSTPPLRGGSSSTAAQRDI